MKEEKNKRWQRLNIYIVLLTLLVIGIAFFMLRTQQQDEVGDYGKWDRQGIDVSHHQGIIDWEIVAEKSTIKFAYIKATEGSSHKDSLYTRNTAEARKSGIAVGSYHYFHPNVDVAVQYANFMSVVDPATQDLVPVIDIEERGGKPSKQICDSLKKFAALIEAEWDNKPIIYTHQRFYNNSLQRSVDDHLLWIARYGLGKVKPSPSLEDNRSYGIWQYSDRGFIEGIKGKVDLNTLNEHCDMNVITLKKQLIK